MFEILFIIICFILLYALYIYLCDNDIQNKFIPTCNNCGTSGSFHDIYFIYDYDEVVEVILKCENCGKKYSVWI